MKDFSNFNGDLSHVNLAWYDESKVSAIITAVKNFIEKKCNYCVKRRAMTATLASFITKEYCKKVDAYKDVIKRTYIKSNGAVYALLRCIGACVTDAIEHHDNILRIGEALAVFEANIEAIISGGEKVMDYSQISATRRKEEEVTEQFTSQGTEDFASALESGDAYNIEQAIAESVKNKELLVQISEEAIRNKQAIEETQKAMEEARAQQTQNNIEQTLEQEPTQSEDVASSEVQSLTTEQQEQTLQNTEVQQVEPEQPQEIASTESEMLQQAQALNVTPMQNIQPQPVAQEPIVTAQEQQVQPAEQDVQQAITPQPVQPVVEAQPVAQPQTVEPVPVVQPIQSVQPQPVAQEPIVTAQEQQVQPAEQDVQQAITPQPVQPVVDAQPVAEPQIVEPAQVAQPTAPAQNAVEQQAEQQPVAPQQVGVPPISGETPPTNN